MNTPRKSDAPVHPVFGLLDQFSRPGIGILPDDSFMWGRERSLIDVWLELKDAANELPDGSLA